MSSQPLIYVSITKNSKVIIVILIMLHPAQEGSMATYYLSLIEFIRQLTQVI